MFSYEGKSRTKEKKTVSSEWHAGHWWLAIHCPYSQLYGVDKSFTMSTKKFTSSSAQRVEFRQTKLLVEQVSCHCHAIR